MTNLDKLKRNGKIKTNIKKHIRKMWTTWLISFLGAMLGVSLGTAYIDLLKEVNQKSLENFKAQVLENQETLSEQLVDIHYRMAGKK